MAKRKSFPSKRERIVEEALYDRMYNAESERGKVILGSARLDDLLRLLISRVIIDGGDIARDEFFDGFNAILQSFGAKISVAYRFGLISEKEYSNLKIIKDVRNAFAHNLHDVSFAHTWIGNKCSDLSFPPNLSPQPADSTFNRFQKMLYQLDLQLQRRIALAGRISTARDLTWIVSSGSAYIKE